MPKCCGTILGPNGARSTWSALKRSNKPSQGKYPRTTGKPSMKQEPIPEGKFWDHFRASWTLFFASQQEPIPGGRFWDRIPEKHWARLDCEARTHAQVLGDDLGTCPQRLVIGPGGIETRTIPGGKILGHHQGREGSAAAREARNHPRGKSLGLQHTVAQGKQPPKEARTHPRGRVLGR
jgi:hypothetical protein